MSTEISLEETNRIRRSLGLTPIAPEPDLDKKTIEQQNGDNADSISLEETNRIRAQLGLKLIPVAAESKTPVALDENENWKNLKEEERRSNEQERIKKKIQQLKDQAERRRQLEGKTIVDEQEVESQGAKSWLKKFRKKQQESAARRFDEDEDEIYREYGESDLSGLRVGHKLSEIEELSNGTILTLKDKSVLEDSDEEEELVSSALQERKSLEESLTNKKGKSKYYDDHDDIMDEEEQEDEHFVLSGTGIKFNGKKSPNKEEVASTNRIEVALDFNEANQQKTTASDYQEPVKFKKFKPKKFKISDKKRKRLDENEDDSSLAVEDDDLDLQSMLSSSRQKVLKQRKKILNPEELAEKVVSDANNEMAIDENQDERVVVSSTTDFLSFIKREVDQPGEITLEHEVNAEQVEVKEEEEDEVKDEGKTEAEDGDVNMSPDMETAEPEDSKTIEFDDEKLSVGGGLAETLRLLKSKGVVDQTQEKVEQENLRRNQREWHKEMERKRIRLESDFEKRRNQARMEAGYDRLNAKQQAELAAMEKQQFELELGKEAQKMFDNYKPVINIEYRDESGNILGTKDAYRHLSHQFHGNKSGKKKVEKQMKKREEELKRESESIFDVGGEDSGGRKKPGIRLQ